jgi:hypothetical protein
MHGLGPTWVRTERHALRSATALRAGLRRHRRLRDLAWEKALAYFADKAMPDNIKQTAMAGAVGEGPSAEFWGFIDVWHKMPKMSDIEANPDKVPVPDEAAQRYAVAVAISGTLTPKNTRPFTTYLRRMDPEFGVLAWQLAMKRDPTVSGTQDFIDFSKEFRAIFAR